MRESCAELKVCFVSYYNYFLGMLRFARENRSEKRMFSVLLVHDSGIGQ